MAGVDFTLIDGLDALTVQTILSEVGLNPERFPTAHAFHLLLRFMSWPKKLLAASLKALKLVLLSIAQEDAFRSATFSVSHRYSASGAFDRRLRSRLGAPKGITATTHKDRSFVLPNLDNCWRIF